MGDGVTYIASAVFYGCTSLAKVTLSRSLEAIESDTFGNTNLVSITIPDNVRSIGFGAFYGCSNLERVNLGRHLRSVDRDAFGGCESLRYTAFDGGEQAFGLIDINQLGNEYLIEGYYNYLNK